jgi:hypothetical protein
MPPNRVSCSLGDVYGALNQVVDVDVKVMIGRVQLRRIVDLVGSLMQGQHKTNGVGCSGRCLDGMQELGSRGVMIRRDSEEMDDGSTISS